MDQEYKIKCNTSEIEILQKSAAYLAIKMSELKKNVPSMSKDKVAVMTALNIVSSFLKQEDDLKEFANVSDEIYDLHQSLLEFGGER